jgi:hypothetical protein
MPQINITPALKGAMVPTDLLTSEGTIHFIVDRRNIQKDGIIFQVLDNNFIFCLGFKNSSLICQRNDTVSVLTTDQLPTSLEHIRVLIMWTFDYIFLSCGMGNHKVEAKVPTTPVAPTQALIKWARLQNLLPVTEYSSEEEFRAKVYSCLNTIQAKIDEAGSINPFWNVVYEGNTIVTRTPKKETDIHPIIHCLLSDQMVLSSIELVPEYQTGVGNLDFMFLGAVKEKGISRICTEFKNAHSRDVYNGLETQLPLYMRYCSAEYGAYCVLGFKGEWFDEPKDVSIDELDFKLKLFTMKSSNPVLGQIRIFTFDVSKPETASKQ